MEKTRPATVTSAIAIRAPPSPIAIDSPPQRAILAPYPKVRDRKRLFLSNAAGSFDFRSSRCRLFRRFLAESRPGTRAFDRD